MPTAQRVILLVEDDVADIELARVALADSQVPHELEAIADGRLALARLLGEPPYEARPRPDLVLLDLNVPSVGGLDLLRQVKENPKTRAIPIVVFSGAQDAKVVRAAYGAHVNAFIHKPNDLSGFTTALRMSADYWLMQVLPAEL